MRYLTDSDSSNWIEKRRAMERNEYLIRKKFYAYLIPGIMMVAALQLGNLLDSVFVGNILGMTALSASSLGMPVVFIAQVPMMILAAGGSTAAAVRLGRQEKADASKIFRISVFGALIIHLIIAAASFLFVSPLAAVLTADPGMEEMCAVFMRLYLLGLPVLGTVFIFAYFMGVDNHPKESAALHITANAVNLVLDYVFLAVIKTGIAGAVYSTIIGYAVSGAIFIVIYFRSPRRMLTFGKPGKSAPGKMPDNNTLVNNPDMSSLGKIPDNNTSVTNKVETAREAKRASLLPEMIKAGAAAGMLLLLNAVRILILNGAVLNMTGVLGMAVYAVSTNSMFLIQLCLHGVSGVVPTIGGILFGDRDYYGIRRLMARVIRISLIISFILTALFILAPRLIGGMFGYDYGQDQGSMDLCLRLFALSFPFYALNLDYQSYYPAVEKSFYATLNTVLQGLVILVPATFALLPFMGVSGTGLASAAAEAASFFIILIILKSRQKSGREEGTDMTALPAAEEGQYLDITVKGTAADAAGLAHKIVDYCTEQGIPRRIANCAGIAAEELVDNITHYSGQDDKISYIDVRLTRTEDRLILRIRDDGVLFDPVSYAGQLKDDADDLDIGGIRLLLALSEKVNYTRALDMNNTIVEVALDKRPAALFKEIVLEPDINENSKLRQFLLEENRIPEGERKKICLASEEVFVNIANYAYDNREKGKIKVEALFTDESLMLRFTDNGTPYDPLAESQDPEKYDPELQIGGLGKLMFHTIMDQKKYEYRNGCNVLTLTRIYKEH